MSAFSAAAFRKPDSFFSPSLMWIWNDRLTEPTIAAQLRDMADHGVAGAMPVPEPKEFRPTWMPTRLEPDYLSPGFVQMVRAAVDQARRNGMRLWLYDEGGWPSGSVCGRLVREHPDLVRQVLDLAEERPAVGTTVTAPVDALGAALVGEDGTLEQVAPGASTRVRKPGTRWQVYRVTARGSYPDLLNPRATDTFISMTHDVYARALRSEFGTTVPAIFTDEPQASARPWTTDLPSAFRRRFGYDLLERLPSLFGGDTDADRRVRIDYQDWWSQRLADAYLGRIQDWCRAHDILSVGHLNGEDETLGAIKHGFGNLMRCMRRLDIPGIDVIWRQLWPGQANSDFPLHAASVAHQEGRRWALSESFAVYGSGLTPEQMKWLVDYQLARGITLFNFVCYPYSTADWLIGGERPHFHDGDPLWPWMPELSRYVARMGYLMSLGDPVAPTALYFPIRDVWAGGRHAEEAADCFDRASRALLDLQCGVDLVDDDVLADATTNGATGELAVRRMRYREVVVPPCAHMPAATRDRLAQFRAAGGRVVWLAGPAWSQAPPCEPRIATEDLRGCVTPLVWVEPPTPGLRAVCRSTATGLVYLFTNESAGAQCVEVTVPGSHRPVLLDPEDGRILRVPSVVVPSARVAGGHVVTLDLPFAGSAVVYCPARARTNGTATAPGSVVRALDAGWTLKPTAAYEIADGGVRIRQRADEAVPAVLGDWRTHLGTGYSGTGTYEVTFDLDAGEARSAAWLDLGDARYAAAVSVNGSDLGRRAWRPWMWHIAGKTRTGSNTLQVTVANTLANQYVTTRALERWTPAQLGPYHPRALQFEPDSLPAGLFGPVTLKAAAP